MSISADSTDKVSMVKAHFLFPGHLISSQDETWVSTVLGSCVAVALYDEHKGIGGLNHFLLPSGEEVGNKPSPRYGNIAITALLEEVLALGANRHSLKAKIYGGASVISFSELGDAVGVKNIEFAERTLQQLGIPVVEKNVGGTQARSIKFNTRTAEVQHKNPAAHQAQTRAKPKAS